MLLQDYETKQDVQKYVPPGFQASPTTVREALLQGKAVLSNEEKWIKGSLFENDDPDHEPDNAFCNSWHACAMGAVAMVVLGAKREITKYDDGEEDVGMWELMDDAYGQNPEDFDLYRDTIQALEAVLPTYVVEDDPEWGLIDAPTRPREEQYSEVWEFNDADGTTYSQVLELFDRAITRVGNV